jgi:hypothetical protein
LTKQFMVDRALDEGSVVNHCEMCAPPGHDLQPHTSEIPYEARRGMRRIVVRRKARDGNIPRRLAFIFMVAGHPESRVDDGKHDTAQSWIVEQLGGGLDVEVANRSAEEIVLLRGRVRMGIENAIEIEANAAARARSSG